MQLPIPSKAQLLAVPTWPVWFYGLLLVLGGTGGTFAFGEVEIVIGTEESCPPCPGEDPEAPLEADAVPVEDPVEESPEAPTP